MDDSSSAGSLSGLPADIARPVWIAGWLYERYGFGSFKARYVVCKGRALHTYKDEDVFNGQLKLTVGLGRIEPYADEPHAFRVTDAKGKGRVFKAQDAEDCAHWMDRLRCAMSSETDTPLSPRSSAVSAASSRASSSSGSTAPSKPGLLDLDLPANLLPAKLTSDAIAAGKRSDESPPAHTRTRRATIESPPRRWTTTFRHLLKRSTTDAAVPVVTWGNAANDGVARLLERLLYEWYKDWDSGRPMSAWRSVKPREFTLHMNGVHVEDAKPVIFSTPFPAGFSWELTSIYSGTPKIAFAWRHSGRFTGTFDGGRGHGKEVTITGFGTARVDVNVQQLYCLELYFDATPFIV
ncbi:hypothetical protein ACHHYP_12951 [Achlya hypogyna]|uniref:PH domain-containing protein n=1 Tax=Achlya hypogyna TaxID=1202772 RepID=A0A1V9ZGC0_ACHHY|nr:hypothetical protein ACHHYP_12951 [Achlya hypogyna]